MGFEKLSKAGKLLTLKKGDILCREDEPGETAFIVLTGAVDVVLNSYSANPLTVSTLMPGSFVGEMSLFLKHKRTATVAVSVNDTTVLEVGMDTFRSYLKEDGLTCFKLMKSLTTRIDDMLPRVGEHDKKFEYQFKSNSFYKLAQQLFPAEFTRLVNEKPDTAINLITYLCSSLEMLNEKYLS